MSGKTKGLVWLLGTAGVAMLFVLGLPWMARQVPWTLEQRLAKIVRLSAGHRVCSTPSGQAALQKLVARLYPQQKEDDRFPVEVQVMEEPSVNAFASFGGQIFILDGLLKQAESPEEVAGVLAHEIAHVSLRHIIEGTIVRLMTTVMLQATLSGGQVDPELVSSLMHLKFSREQEAQADHGGLARLRQAEIDVSGFVKFFDRMGGDSAWTALLSDHPSNVSRAEMAKAYRGGAVRPVLTDAQWQDLKAICRP